MRFDLAFSFFIGRLHDAPPSTDVTSARPVLRHIAPSRFVIRDDGYGGDGR